MLALNTFFNPRHSVIQQGGLFIICTILAVAVLVLDLAFPLGVAGGVPYVLVVLVSLGFSKQLAILFFALLCSLLTVVGFFYSPPGGILWVVLINRLLALFAIWVTAILGFLQKRNNQKLIESEARFHFMANTAPLMICLLNDKYQFTFLSRSLQKMLGREPLGELVEAIEGRLHVDDKQKFLSKMKASFAKKIDLQLECRLINKQGEYRWLLVQAAPRLTEAGDFSGYIATFLDITDKKCAEWELDEMRSMSYHHEKMVEIGTLSAGIIHEVGTPVSAIYGLTQAILDASEEGESEARLGRRTREDVIAIMEQTERLMGITHEVMSFAAVSDGDGEIFDPNELVERCCRLMNYDAKMKSIDLRNELMQEAPALAMKKSYIIQILLNLLSNAAHACIGIKRPVITVKTGCEGDVFVITVDDNGCGMTQEAASRAIEPFYTTKPIGQGTGLGLAMCKALVDQNKGQLKIASEPDKGTQIQILLPICEIVPSV